MSAAGRTASSGQIRERDARAMLSFVSELAAHDRPEDFRTGVVSGLRELVPCETAAYNEIDLASGSVFAFSDPADIVPPGGVEALARLRHQNPLIVRCERTRDGRPYKWSDLITRRELHRTELYTELYKPLGIEYQMAFLLPSSTEELIGLTVNRATRDFSERDRKVLNLVRSPLIQAYRSVQRYAELAERLVALERGLERRGIGVVVLKGDSPKADFVSDEAARALGLRQGGMPARVREWVDEARRMPAAEPVAPLVLEGEGGVQAALHFVPARRDGDREALLVERAGELLSVEHLRGAGLTPRQAQILHHVALGRSNTEIAKQLVVSPRTVEKHLQNIYDRLGARSRTQAIQAAWAVARGGGDEKTG